MKLVKSLLLGSAAGLAAVAGANAADLPARGKVAPVEFVRVCSTYGAGFFFIPGTETCLRVAGRARAEMLYLEPNTRADDTIGFRAQARLSLDSRTATAYGTLRAFVRINTQTRSGDPYGRAGTVDTTGLDQAFIQFGGLTAGRVTSNFSPNIANEQWGTLRFDDAPDIAQFAYTFSFGGGFSATIAVEDGQDRRLFGLGTTFGPLLPGEVIGVAAGGQTVPDVVANVKYESSFGKFQLSGALHQIRDVSPFVDTEYGFAVQGSANVMLPFLGAGDQAYIVAAYSQGAASYSGFGGSFRGFLPLGGSDAGGLFSGVPDAVIDPVTGDIEKTDIFNIAAGITHYWTPTVRSNLFGSYAHVEFGESATVTDAVTGDVIGGLADFNEWRVGANVIWSPVSGLNIGVEAIYADADFRGSVGSLITGRDIGSVEGRLRVQRDF